jgi:oligopeptide transport system ATP-binding protein
MIEVAPGRDAHAAGPIVDSRGALLTVDNLHVEFAGRQRTVRAVRGLSYAIKPGETLGLVGESGSGKSVSALSLLGLLPARVSKITAGSAMFDGRELIGMPEEQLRRVRGSKIAMIFQDPLSSLNPVLTIGRQITEALETHKGMDRRAAQRRAVELLELVGIPSAKRRVNDYPHQFSGGMRQRAMIAMALSCEPSLLIADEPTTALDVTIQAQVLALIRRLARELGVAVLLVSHDLGIISQMCHRVLVLYAGRVVEEAPVAAIFRNPAHPYTRGLIDCLPQLHGNGRLGAITGMMPGLRALPTGCRFHPRCPIAEPRCSTESPASRLVATGHVAACHLAEAR